MDKLIASIIKKKRYLSDDLHEISSIKDYNEDAIGQAVSESWLRINYKAYPRLDSVRLPEPLSLKVKLQDALKKRRSRRKFNGEAASLEELSTLLQRSAGITKKRGQDWDSALRAYPSAGARYPLEVYLIASRVDGLESGLYHYNIKEHSLEVLRREDLSNFVSGNTGQSFTSKAAFIIIISAVLDRTRIKYQERGYRFVFLDAGHLGQNFYLVSEGLGLKCCAIGGFVDEEFNKLLDLQDQGEKVIYLFAFGK